MASRPSTASAAEERRREPRGRRGSPPRTGPRRGSRARRRASCPTPATKAATTVCQRALVSTIVAIIGSARRHGVDVADPARERERDQAEPDGADQQRADGAREQVGDQVGERRRSRRRPAGSGARRRRCCRPRPSAPPRAACRRRRPSRRRRSPAWSRAESRSASRGEDHRRARPLGREPLRRVHLDDPRPHRPDDPPAAGVGAERDRGRRRDDHPGRRPRSPRRRGCRSRSARARSRPSSSARRWCRARAPAGRPRAPGRSESRGSPGPGRWRPTIR